MTAMGLGLGLFAGLFAAGCDRKPATSILIDASAGRDSEAGPDTTGAIHGPEVGPEVGSDRPGDLGGGILQPADDECLGQNLSVEEAQGLCQWGTSIVGPEGTVLRAACLDIVVDAGAPPPGREAAMVDMVVLSQATCVARVRGGSSSLCAYTVGQFKLGVNAFHEGNCGAGAAMALVGYMTAADGGVDTRH